jgi:hypothetical protein
VTNLTGDESFMELAKEKLLRVMDLEIQENIKVLKNILS